MSYGKKYWLSPQRGLPRPTGRLAGVIDAPEMGAFEEPWPEEGSGRRPPPVYLQSRVDSLDAIQDAARVHRFLQQANARTQLAHGPGAGSGLPQPGYDSAGAGAVGSAWLPTTPLIGRPYGAQQLYGAGPYESGGGAAGFDPAVADQAGLGGGLMPGVRPPPSDLPPPRRWDNSGVGPPPRSYDPTPKPPSDERPFDIIYRPGTTPPSKLGRTGSALAGGAYSDWQPNAFSKLPMGLMSPSSSAYDLVTGVRPDELQPLPDHGYEAGEARREWIDEENAGPLGSLDF